MGLAAGTGPGSTARSVRPLTGACAAATARHFANEAGQHTESICATLIRYGDG